MQGREGPCFIISHSYPPGTQHASHLLAAWLELAPATLAVLGDAGALAHTDPRQLIFLDTETTGLGGGAFAFLVGIGYFNEDAAFEVRQFFLRDPSEEPAMLAMLQDHLPPGSALVTFNGRTFDVPLLAGRFVMVRRPSPVAALPNLDLLHPARRLWRRRLESCALSALESAVLGLQRTQQDVPGSVIPYLYRQYLQTHDAGDMVRVLYHNEMDLLSMVALGITLAHAFERPAAPGLPVADRLSLARWYGSRGLLAEAEAAYRAATDEAGDAQARHDALVGLATLLKGAQRRAEAVPLWEFLADLKHDTLGHVELAKHYEWHARDLPHALRWTEAGISLAEAWRPGWRRTAALRDLAHRRERLLRKLNNLEDDTQEET
jgi:hypothetical protein